MGAPGTAEADSEIGASLSGCGGADNGLLALEEIKRLRPQVLFTDIRMPKMTGIDLLCKIREEKLDVQTILISGYAEFKYAQAALRNGALDYILKPIQEKELIQILEKLAAVLLPEQNFFGGEDLCLQKFLCRGLRKNIISATGI